ncbi:DUF6221 family protein [Streptomyces sp. NPDC087512]|uniref:DUF6221 family protein n=1 Tax=Streptomyces sp. NPDC087512 TaxID=3155059 RepID=UPI0034340384
MDDLVGWLGRQLDEDERLAKAAAPGPWHAREDGVAAGDGRHWPVAYTDSRLGSADCEHIAAWDPARVLREVDAKREVLAFVERRLRESTERDFLVRDPAKTILFAVDPVIRYLAMAYADRPGYREEWRPKPE